MDEQIPATEEQNFALTELGPGLKKVRRRRWWLWGVVLLYLPIMVPPVEMNWSLKATGIAFLLWYVLLFAAALYMALARCPHCGNYFHLHGLTYLPLRRCLHCQLHINADKLR